MAENELIVIKELNPVEVFTPDGISGVLKTIEEKVLSHVPNLETPAGRKDIASLAFKVARSKTLLDDMGKKLVEEAKKTVKTIDGHRKEVRDKLDTLKEKVRQPLTDWEAEEEKRKEESERIAQEKAQERVDALARVGISLPFLSAKELSEDDYGAMLREATEAHEAEIARQAEEQRIADEKMTLEKKAREEEAAKLAAERAELDRIRAEEDAKRKAEEARMKAERDKLESERRAIEKAKMEQEHREAIAKAAKEAAEKALKEASERQQREIEEQRIAQEKAYKETADKPKDDGIKGFKIVIHSWENSDYEIREQLTINGRVRQYVGPCEPEDAIIGRDLVSCSDIVEFMREAHTAGLEGMPFDVTLIERDPDED